VDAVLESRLDGQSVPIPKYYDNDGWGGSKKQKQRKGRRQVRSGTSKEAREKAEGLSDLRPSVITTENAILSTGLKNDSVELIKGIFRSFK